MLSVLELRTKEFSELITTGRCQFQAWLNAHTFHVEEGA
jgi:hypothetical protein